MRSLIIVGAILGLMSTGLAGCDSADEPQQIKGTFQFPKPPDGPSSPPASKPPAAQDNSWEK